MIEMGELGLGGWPASAGQRVTNFFQIKINYSLKFPFNRLIGNFTQEKGTGGLTNLKKSGTRGRQGDQEG